MKRLESQEDYLEKILQISKEKDNYFPESFKSQQKPFFKLYLFVKY